MSARKINYAQKSYLYRGLCLFITMLMLIGALNTVALASQTVDVAIQRLSDTVYIPLRETSEALGFEVSWDDSTRTAYIKTGEDTTVAYKIGEGINAPFIKDGRTYVSIESFCRNHGIYCVQSSDNSERYTFITVGTANIDEMMQDMELLTATPRVFGTESTAAAREFISNTFKELGYDVEIQDFTPNEQWGGTLTGHNIIATKKPASPNANSDILVLAAHYDSVAGAPGANDNGSGTTAILELAELLKDFPSDTELRIIAFDGEEDGLLGSYHYITNLPEDESDRIIGMINFDMFASVECIDIVQVITPTGKANYLTDMFTERGFDLQSEMGTDSTSFVSQAIPSVSFSDIRDNVYHSPRDTTEFIDTGKLSNVTNSAAGVIAYILSDATGSFADKKTPVMDKSKVYSIELGGRMPYNMSVDTFEVQFGIDTDGLTEFMMKSDGGSPFSLSSAYGAMIDIWGEPLETYFVYNRGMSLSSVKIILNGEESIAKAVAYFDGKFGASDFTVDKQSLYTTYEYTDENGEKVEAAYLARSNGDTALVEIATERWEDEYGNEYFLTNDGTNDIIYITQYYNSQYFQVIDGKLVFASYDRETGESTYTEAQLNEAQTAAWNILSAALEQMSMLDELGNVSFVKDGYGGTDFAMYSNIDGPWELLRDVHTEEEFYEALKDYVPKSTLSVSIDPNDLLDEKGSIYGNEALIDKFADSYVQMISYGTVENVVYQNPSFDDQGRLVGYSSTGTSTASYYEKYILAALKDILTEEDYAVVSKILDLQMNSETTQEELMAMQDEIMAASLILMNYQDELMNLMTDYNAAFKAYLTGNNPDEIAQSKIDFFGNYPELAEHKEKLSALYASMQVSAE